MYLLSLTRKRLSPPLCLSRAPFIEASRARMRQAREGMFLPAPVAPPGGPESSRVTAIAAGAHRFAANRIFPRLPGRSGIV